MQRDSATVQAPLPFAQVIIDWQRQHGRHDLPWQDHVNAKDSAYRIWLSEIMLQQTQVAAVIPYYARFLARFPNLQSLAAAALDEVMQLWSGLGYYSRARNLHACARRIVDEFQGEFPQRAAVIQTLPGIGRSTAAAIAAFAFNERAAILDGNVKRVLCRVFGIDAATPAFAKAALLEKHLWGLAESLLSNERGGEIAAYTQGLMDFGATLCTPRKPACLRCPLSNTCIAYQTNRVDQLPAKKLRPPVPERHTQMLVLRHADAIWLYQRPPVGIWGGLWSLPENAETTKRDAAIALAQIHGSIESIEELAPLTHGFTHFKLNAEVLQIRLSHLHHKAADAAQLEQWIKLSNVEQVALPTPIKKLLLGLN